MSEEIICLSSDDEEIICLSSDDEDTCIENSTEAGITSISSTKKNTEYQFSTYDSETWRKRVVAEEEERCIYYEEEVKKQDEISYLEKYVEKRKLESEESQTNLANFLVNPANSHLEDIISIAIHAEKSGYKSILEEVIFSKETLKMLENRLAMHKSNLKIFMQTDSEFLESVKHDEKKF